MSQSFMLHVAQIVERIEYNPAVEIAVGSSSDRVYLQVRATAPCALSGTAINWHGRKWFLSGHMTDSEIVSTAFKALLASEEHECRERFRYRGQRIFGPHLDVDSLAFLLQERQLRESIR